MNFSALARKANPVYVLVLGVLGGAIPFFMFLWHFPASTQPEAQAFAHAPTFLTWVFLLSTVSLLVTILLIPSWRVLKELFVFIVHEYPARNVILKLTTSAVMYICVLVPLYLLSARVIDLPDATAQGNIIMELNLRFAVVYLYTALGFFPVMFCIILLHDVATIFSSRIPLLKDNNKKISTFINEYLEYRNLLQVCLVTAGILMSLNPIVVSAYFSTWNEAGLFASGDYPAQSIIVYGLIFTLLLILIYVPTYIALSNVGRELRDTRYPLNMDNLEEALKKRKVLDDVLQTNIGITENLKNGIFTLSPLVSGLVASLLGIK